MAKSWADCPTLPRPIPLYSGKESLGFIQPNAITQEPTQIELIRHPVDVPNIPLYIPLYLDSLGIGACAYPVKLNSSTNPQNFTQRIQEKKFVGQPPHFGIPTQLQVKEKHLNGVFFDKEVDRFYVQTIQGGLWYLVGDSKNYDSFLDGIHQFANHLYDHWKHNPDAIYSLVDWELEGPPPIPARLPEEAEAQIGKFLPWLKSFDPELYKIVLPRIFYAERMPIDESSWCENPIKTTSAAFYENETDKIFLMPEAIMLLEQGKYTQIAQLLAHERGHRNSSIHRLVIPSEQMMGHSLDRFLNRVAREGGILQRAWVYIFGKSIYQGAFCRLLPLLPEEEIHAYSSDIRYAREKGLEKNNTSFSIQDRLDWISDLKGNLEKDFSPAWSFLASQYFYLAQSLGRK